MAHNHANRVISRSRGRWRPIRCASSKLRSFLTLLGIILATTTLIAVMAMIHGMDVYIANTVSNMGSDGFRIVKIAFLGNFDPKKYLQMQKRNPELSPDEFQYLKDHATLVSDFGMSAGRTVTVSLGIANADQYLLERRHSQLGGAGQHPDRRRAATLPTSKTGTAARWR